MQWRTIDDLRTDIETDDLNAVANESIRNNNNERFYREERRSEPKYMGSILTMEPGALLQHGLAGQSDFPLPSEHDYIDDFQANAHHSSYNSTSTTDQLRRDGALSHQNPRAFTFTPANHPQVGRFGLDRAVAPDATSYHHHGVFTDSSSGSISTSPSSAASSLAYTNYSGNHYTSLPAFAGSVQQPQAFTGSNYAATRLSSLLDGSGSGILSAPSLRSPISSSVNGIDRDAYVHPTHFLANTRSLLPPNTHPTYDLYPQTPRGVLSGTAGLSLSPGSTYPSHMATAAGYGGTSSECANFPWPHLEVVGDMTCEGQDVTPEVHAKVEKGLFPAADQKWTCYRRNYFSVQCSFELRPNINNGRMYLEHENKSMQIQAMGMRLSAVVDGPAGKIIELIQHTPKRDAGPKTKIEVVKVAPTPTAGRSEHTLSPHGVYQVPMQTFHATGAVPSPYLPLQNAVESNGSSPTPPTSHLGTQYPYSAAVGSHLPMSGQSTNHTFERVQFKTATANNGKRRASQQYFQLVVELLADVRKDGSDTPDWVKVAQRRSEKIVVRGRSPSHYQNEGQHGSTGRGGSTSGGSTYSTGGATGYSNMSAGAFRSSNGGSFSGAGGSGGYRMHVSSEGSGSDPGSADEGAVDADHPTDALMSGTDRTGGQDYDGYQYYPSTIYEGVPNQLELPPLIKVEGVTRYSTEPRQYAVKTEYADAVPGAQWSGAGCGRFQGVDTSRGYYPDLSTGFLG